MKSNNTNWEWKKLGEVTECLDSKRIPVTKNQREKGDVPYYGANGIQGYVKEFIFDEELLLLAEDGGSWGNNQKCTYIIRGKSWVNNHAHVLRMRPTILIKFLEAYLNLKDLTKYISGTTRGKLNQKQMNAIEIPVPPLPIQQKIVSILERAESLKQKREQANEEANKIIQSIFYERFGDPIKNEKNYPVKPLVEICNKITDGTHVTPKYTGQGIPFLRVTDLTNSNDSKKFISEEEHKDLIKRCKPEKEDILYSKNGTIGVAKLIDWDYEFSIFVSLCLIKPKKEIILPKYLEIFLNTPFALRQALSHSKKGTITNLHLIEIKKILVPIPSIKEQEEFLKKVDKVGYIQKKQNQATSEINTLFDALMQNAFKGELVG